MLIEMTIANFRSIKMKQTLSFSALRDKRMDSKQIVDINDKLRIIRTGAVIGPNGVGKSTFIRALEALKGIITAEDDVENPLFRILAGTPFAYSENKGGPAFFEIKVLLDKGESNGIPIIAQYNLEADSERIFNESLYFFYGNSRKLMFERIFDDCLCGECQYRYRWGKMYRGEKKRLEKKLSPKHTFLSQAARKGGETCGKLYDWIVDSLDILPLGAATKSEKYVADTLTNHPEWIKQVVNFFWSIDITDVRNIVVKNDKVFFIHTNVTQAFSANYMTESLSLRRLSLFAVAFFEAFTSDKTLVIDDFGMFLHPYVLIHIVQIFQKQCTGTSQMLCVDCNPTLLEDNLIRRDGIYFAQKGNEGATEYYPLSDFRYSTVKGKTKKMYEKGAFGALPITSEFSFIDEEI